MDKNSIAKALVTLVMWTVAAGIAVTALMFSSHVIDWVLASIVLVPLAFSLAGTIAVWTSGENTSHLQAYSHIDEKAKRSTSEDSRMMLLLEMMDDEEREAFKETLKRRYLRDVRLTDDGELSGGMADLWEDGTHEQRFRS